MINFVSNLPWWKMCKFAVVNVGAFVPNIGLALFLMSMGVQYIWASMCGVMVHIVILFVFNRSWTFAKPEIPTGRGISKSMLIECVIITVMLGTLSILVEQIGLDPQVGRLISSIPGGILGWILYTTIVFESHPFKNHD